MATAFINWHKDPDYLIRGSLAPVEGVRISGLKVTSVSTASTQSGAAPTGAKYATIWADEAVYIDHGSNPTAISPTSTNTSITIPANTLYHIPKVIGGTTKIAFKDVS